MRYVRSLDGIRGLAVSLVVLFHFGLFPAGWIGVQIFFVLSGYLITGILLRERERDAREYLGRFYWRRSLRIFPLYSVFLALSFAAYLTTGEPQSLGSDWPYLVTYTTNFARLRSTDIGSAFIHLWSLAVEEQFYLFWPFVVYFASPAAFKRVVLAIILLSPIIRLALYFAFLNSGHDADWIGRNIYCLPFTQFDSFATGAALVLWQAQFAKNAGRWFLVTLTVTALCGTGVLLHDHFFYKNAFKESLGYSMYLMPDWGFVWGYTLINLAAVFLIACATRGTQALRFLEAAPIVWIGSISYGVYVYHVPALRILDRLNVQRPLLFVLYVTSVLIVSSVSFKWLETPFLRLKDRNAER
jgi:peptidoglycan/LPS O-acetylase OafA/YrhL